MLGNEVEEHVPYTWSGGPDEKFPPPPPLPPPNPPLEKPDCEREFKREKIPPLPLLGDENDPRPRGVYPPPLLMAIDVFFLQTFVISVQTGELFSCAVSNVCVPISPIGAHPPIWRRKIIGVLRVLNLFLVFTTWAIRYLLYAYPHWMREPWAFIFNVVVWTNRMQTCTFSVTCTCEWIMATNLSASISSRVLHITKIHSLAYFPILCLYQ